MNRLILEFDEQQDKRIRVSYRLLGPDGHELADTAHGYSPGSVDEALELSSHIQKELALAIAAIGPDLEQPNVHAVAPHLEELRRLGQELGTSLLPASVIQVLVNNTTVEHVQMEYHPRLGNIAFEAMHVGGEYLGFRFGIGRKPAVVGAADPAARPNSPASYKAFSLIDPYEQLIEAGATELRNQFRDFRRSWERSSLADGRRLSTAIDFSRHSAFRRVSKQDALDAFRNVDIVSIIAHHVYVSENASGSGFVLQPAKGQDPPAILTAADIEKALTPAGVTAPRLLLAIACRSTAVEHFVCDEIDPNQAPAGMVECVHRCGIQHYIGSTAKIPAAQAPTMLFPFYQSLAAGGSVGQSLRALREAIRGNSGDDEHWGTAIGLALVLYGAPSTVYLCEQGHKVRGLEHTVCTAPTHHAGVCGRTICGQDTGFAQRRCRDHLPAKPTFDGRQDQGDLQSCPHCGRWIDTQNALAGNCVDCGKSLCANCGPWHDRTSYCPGGRSDDDREQGWLETLRNRAATEDQRPKEDRQVKLSVVTKGRLQGLSELSARFQMAVHENLDSSAAHSVDGEPFLADATESNALPTTQHDAVTPWQLPHDWIIAYRQAVQVRFYLVRLKDRQRAVVAVASLVPLEFQDDGIPWIVRGNGRMLRLIREIATNWWRTDGQRGSLPDLYIVACNRDGWAQQAEDTVEARFVALAEPDGEDWSIRSTTVDGVPQAARTLVDRLTMNSPGTIRGDIRQHVGEVLECEDYVTLYAAQAEVEAKRHQPISDDLVMDVFEELGRTDRYRMDRVNHSPALRRANKEERTKRLIRRQRLGTIACIAGIVAAISAIPLIPGVSRLLSGWWHSVTIGLVATAFTCHLISRGVRHLSLHLKNRHHRD